jgi:hypothetical protein
MPLAHVFGAVVGGSQAAVSHAQWAFNEWLSQWADDGGITGRATQEDLEDAFAAGDKAGSGPYQWMTSEVPVPGIKGGEPR